MSLDETPAESQGPGEEPKGLQWVVACPKHGARAHLYMEGLDRPNPWLLHCSLKPGEFPPSCDHACMSTFKLKPAEDGDLEETVSDG